MDSELWASLLSATKRRLALQVYRSDQSLSHDDLEAHDEVQVEYNCPFCSGEFDIGSLCSHIEEEHCFEPKAAVCPLCFTKVKSDMVGHITFQHEHLFKISFGVLGSLFHFHIEHMQRRRFRMAVASIGSTLSSIIKDRGVAALQVNSSEEGGEVCKPNGASLMGKECTTQESNCLVFDILGSGDADDISELCRAWVQVRYHHALVFFVLGARATFITPQLAEKVGIKTDEMGPAYTASMVAPGHEVVVMPLIGKLRLHIQGYVGHEEV
ncbi:hypothetical protein L7F22_043349 [Adiantum nelumboides]|nr:hypothetical protein [Adiantum nelumboides]